MLLPLLRCHAGVPVPRGPCTACAAKGDHVARALLRRLLLLHCPEEEMHERKIWFTLLLKGVYDVLRDVARAQDNCEFRHCWKARNNETVCRNWKGDGCDSLTCFFRHPPVVSAPAWSGRCTTRPQIAFASVIATWR